MRYHGHTVKSKLPINRFEFESVHYGTPEGTFLFQYLPEKKLKQKELEKKSKQYSFKRPIIFPSFLINIGEDIPFRGSVVHCSFDFCCSFVFAQVFRYLNF